MPIGGKTTAQTSLVHSSKYNKGYWHLWFMKKKKFTLRIFGYTLLR